MTRRQDMQMLLERQRAVNAAARAMTTGAKGSNKAFGRDKAVILSLGSWPEHC